MKRYTLGLGFTEDSVVMIEKQKPAWQAGKFNFVGGKIEDGETGPDCMAREFFEETGVVTLPEDWMELGLMERQTAGGEDDFVCLMYVSNHPDIRYARTMEAERIEIVGMEKFSIDNDARKMYISNIPTIFEFAMSSDFRDQGAHMTIQYP